MGKISLEISIEPKILSWARQSIGLSRDTVAKKLRTSENSVIAWESGDRKTTLTTLKKLSNIYKRLLHFSYQSHHKNRQSQKIFVVYHLKKRKYYRQKLYWQYVMLAVINLYL